MTVYEVFLKRAGKEEFRHAGALEAPDDQMALTYAREAYARRSEGSQMWLVQRANIVEADSVDLATNQTKSHRHNDGSVIAARRKQKRAEAKAGGGND